MTTIKWNATMLARFQESYANAVAGQVETFPFEGNDYIVGYAEYLIEYLTTMFPPICRGNQPKQNTPKWKKTTKNLTA